MIRPFAAAFYSASHRSNLSALATADLDTAEHLWGGTDYSKAFRNVLIGSPEQRGEVWQAWISGGDIELSDDLRFYVLRQRYENEGKRVDRWALYCELDIHEPQLYIHEDVLAEGVERARQATEACETDMAPIFVGCDESLSRELRMWLEAAVQNEAVLLSFTEASGASHEVWPMPNGVAATHVEELLKEAPLFLLDGHHRLAAARENHRFGIGDGKILACVCSMGAADTLILPIHRAVHYERWMLPDQLSADLVRADCKLSEVPELKVTGISAFLERHISEHPFCLMLHSHSDKPMLVHLPRAEGQPEQIASLPVACLDYAVLGQHPQATCMPAPNHQTALQQLATDHAQAVFFLPASKPEEVRAVALSKLKMPRKSTRFVPKPALGLICRPWGSQ